MRPAILATLLLSCASLPPAVLSRQTLCDGAPDCTIELDVQTIIEEELDRLAAHRRSVIVVLDPSTGSILGLGGRDLGKSAPWLAGTRPVDPGSIMKTFTIALALENGVVNEATQLAGEGGRWRFQPDELITDHTAHGMLSVEDVLVFSSNIGTAKVAAKLGAEPLADLYDVVGLADASLRPMRPGVVPDLRKLKPAAALRVAYGAGVEPTPLQLASSFSIFAARGVHRPLSLTLAGQHPARQVIAPDTAIRMQRLLAQTVARDDGTGARARLPSLTVAGKTGTWRLEEGVNWANFAGFPLENSPRFVVLVGVETTTPGYGGGTVAAPSFARILSALTTAP